VNLAAATAVSVALWPAVAAHAASAPVRADRAPAGQAAAARGGAAPITAEALAAGVRAFGRNATREQALAAYWTPARMRAAKPAEQSPGYVAAVAKARTEKASAPHWGKPFSYPHAEPVRTGRAAFTTDPNFPSNHPTAMTMGKVFYDYQGVGYECSGTVVNTRGLNSVWTAGHCVHGGQGGGLVSNWQFIPAYNTSLANPLPYGTWAAVSLWPATGWWQSSTAAEDMAVAIVAPHGATHIVQAVGGQGLQANTLLNVTENAFGYPAQSPFDGGHLRQCTGLDAQEGSTWQQTVKIPCTMTRGASGGGWLLNYDGRYGSLNGVNSRVDSAAAPTYMASPYFDDTALNLFNFTANM
jgi:V8-like Glu-specific endopeptidase